MIQLRKATAGDCKAIYEWRNHPSVRSFFFDPRDITYDEHRKWFEESLRKEGRFILMALEERELAGVLRFDVVDPLIGMAEIDIYVAPDRQGRGVGREILREGEDWARANTRIRILTARVKEDNSSSLKMFRNRGFRVKHVHFEKELASEGGFGTP